MGWPGSVHDNTCFCESKLYQEKEKYFSFGLIFLYYIYIYILILDFFVGEYCLGDSAYELSATMVTPFKRPAANIEENSRFNLELAKV